jgi:hypothetical protein
MHASEVFCTRRGIVKSIPREMVNDDAFLAVAAKKAGYLIVFLNVRSRYSGRRRYLTISDSVGG